LKVSSGTVLLDHGSGGLASQELIKGFLSRLNNPALNELEDCAILNIPPGRLAFSTDSYVVDPIFFPGGNIGDLAVHGTINDLAMRGAHPTALSLGLILEEGLPLADLKKIIESIAQACEKANVPVVTGDTKVVPHGKGDKIFINTAGVGIVPDGLDLGARQVKAGDKIILSGSMGDHGITIMVARHKLAFEGDLASDSQALHNLTAALCSQAGGALHAMRDPTRGGVATTLCEIAETAGVAMILDEETIPVHPQVQSACELLGLEPLYLANEGKCLVIVADDFADEALQIMRQIPAGKEAAIIGRVQDGPAGRVEITTLAGGRRLVTALTGEPLPRIC
jgi:hydrogenase expression/formation protein HypE